MKWALALLTLTTLAACGADGEPVPPTRNATITLSDSGASAHLRTGVTRGPLTVTLGLGL